MNFKHICDACDTVMNPRVNVAPTIFKLPTPNVRWENGCEENNGRELVCVCVEVGGGRSQLEDETSVHITREGVSVWFTGKFQGSAMGPVRSGIKKGLT